MIDFLKFEERMHLPEELQQFIEVESNKFTPLEISKAREILTQRYQKANPSSESLILTDAERCAYVVARMPATYAVILRVLKELQLRCPNVSIESLLDLGAGPGSVMWAANRAFPHLKEIQMIERDSALAALGKRLASNCEVSAFANWQIRSMEHFSGNKIYDLVTLSYSIGELSETMIPVVLEKSWQSTGQFLVVIEPGTPGGFERIRLIRDQLIAFQGHLVAPCPHSGVCPMQKGDWCHFPERIERTALHRRIKQGALGYEDEKYSYLIFSKNPVQNLPEARILRHPIKRSGHLVMNLCTETNGLQQQTISKRTPEFYKQARKLDWGEGIKF